MPRSEDEYMRLPQVFSMETTALTVMGCMAICTALCLVTNLAFANFSSKEFSSDEFSVLGLSLNYSPTPTSTISDDAASGQAALPAFPIESEANVKLSLSERLAAVSRPIHSTASHTHTSNPPLPSERRSIYLSKRSVWTSDVSESR